MSIAPINGGSEFTPMTPQERKLWLAVHNAPDEYVLVTKQEMLTMGNAMNRQVQMTHSMARTHRAIERELKDYWKSEPDIVNAAGAAAFDGDKFKKQTERDAIFLNALSERLSALALPAKLSDIEKVIANINEQLGHIKKTSEKHRNRSEPVEQNDNNS